MSLNKILLVLMIWLVAVSAKSQAPTWSVNANDFENSMTITSSVKMSNAYSFDVNDKIAAFIDGEVRGVANVNITGLSNDRKLAFLTVYSSSVGGSEISFKLYDASENVTYDAVTKVTFQKDASVGSVNSPKLVTDNNAPTSINISNDRVNENVSNGTVVGAFSSVDLDTNDIFTYQLVSGDGADDNASFKINGLNLTVASDINHETKDKLKIRVKSIDPRDGFFEKAFIIKVNNLNDKPTDISLSELNVNENVSVNTLIGELSTTDEDAGDTFKYELTVGTDDDDNDLVKIDSNKIYTKELLDFENQQKLKIRIKSSDSDDEEIEKSFVINVKDLNDAPTDIVLETTGILENKPRGTLVGTFSTIDEDNTDNFTYTFDFDALNVDNQSFEIRKDSIFSKVDFDYEEKQFYEIKVKSKDKGSRVIAKTFTIDITQVNEAPKIEEQSFSIKENSVSGTKIGQYKATDEDENTTFKFTFLRTDRNFPFTLSESGKLTIKDGVSVNYEEKKSYEFDVIVRDNFSLSDTATMNVKIIDLNEQPSDITLTTSGVEENKPSETIVGSFATTDQDEGESFTYEFVFDSNDLKNSNFRINDNQLLTKKAFDYEKNTSFKIKVRVTDNQGSSFDKVFEIPVLPVNEAPTIDNQSFTLKENTDDSNFFANLKASDVDDNTTLTYSFLNEIGEKLPFSLDSSSGKFSVKKDSLIDFEKKSMFKFNVKVTDEKLLKDSAIVIIKIEDINEKPTNIIFTSKGIPEEQPIGTLVGEFETIDEDVFDEFIYSLIENTDDNQFFKIVENRLYSAVKFDFEEKIGYNIKVQSSDKEGNAVEKVFKVDILQVNEPPVMNNQTFEVKEDLESNQIFAKLKVEDTDVSSKFKFSFLDTITSKKYPIELIRETGEFKVKNNSILNYEETSQYDFKVKVEDEQNASDTARITINILDVLEQTLSVNNFVSANNDDKNDYFKINNIQLYQRYKLDVYDANGAKVYSSSNYKNDWNGNSKTGNLLPIGVYYYVFRSPSNTFQYKGKITLVR